MLALLGTLAISKQIRKVDPNNNDASFDLEIVDGNNHKRITKAGYYVAFRRYDDDGNPQDFCRLSKSNNYKCELTNNYNVRLQFEPNGDNQKIILFITNTAGKLVEYDISVFAEFQDTELGMTLHDTAIESKSGDKYHMNVIKGIMHKQHCKDPDHIYIGKFKTTGVDPNDYPYWIDPEDKTTGNPVCVFSWHGFALKGTPTELAFVVSPVNTYKRPPVIYDRTFNSFNQFPQEFDYNFDIVSYEPGEITVSKFCLYSTNELTNFNSDGVNNINHSYTLHIKQDPTVAGKSCYVMAKNSQGEQSSLKTIDLEGQQPPTFRVTESPKDKNFEIAETIVVRGYAEDEQKVIFHCTIDNKYDQNYEVVTAPRGIKSFKISMKVPELANGEHKFKITAHDQIGKPAETKEFKFNIVPPTKPKIDFVASSRPRVTRNMTIIIVGAVIDPDHGQRVNITARWDRQDATPTNLYSYISQGNLQAFSKWYTIPDQELTPGKHRIFIQAFDESNKYSQFMEIVVFVVDPNPLPANIGKIIDTTSSLKEGKSYFNVNYRKGDENAKAMSYNDEGFYVGYRLYDSRKLPRADTYLLERKEVNERENISIRCRKEYEEQSGYLQVKFDITNNGYFEQYIDFGVFVDSYWGDTDQELQFRKDGTGIVVSDEKANLYYTVFTTYGDFPPATVHNIAPNITRPKTGEIDVSNMTFFEPSEEDTYLGSDPMYSIGWIKQPLLAGETTTLVLTFAGYDILRTPSRITTEVIPAKERYAENQEVTLKIRIKDENILENLTYELEMTGMPKETVNFTVGSDDKMIEKKVRVGTGPSFDYSISVIDNQVHYPIRVKRSLFVSNTPIQLNIHNIDSQYLYTDTIKINGTVSYPKPVNIKYQFGPEGKVETLGKYTTNINGEIQIPAELPTRYVQWDLIVWAETDEGFMSEKNFTAKFFVFVPDKPVLVLAGISKKKARRNDRILGYAFVTDTQIGQYFMLKVKLGKNGEYMPLKAPYDKFQYDSVSIKDPVAFYWQVPETAVRGKTYDVYIKAFDSTGLSSDNEIPCTLYIEY